MEASDPRQGPHGLAAAPIRQPARAAPESECRLRAAPSSGGATLDLLGHDVRIRWLSGLHAPTPKLPGLLRSARPDAVRLLGLAERTLRGSVRLGAR